MKLWFQIVIDLLLMLRSPGGFFFGVFELFLSWFQSRRWWAALYLVPIVLPIGAIAYPVIAAYRADSSELLGEYWSWIDEETQIESGGKSSGDDPNKISDAGNSQTASDALERSVSMEGAKDQLIAGRSISQFAETLIRKSLVLDGSNTRGIYFAATALSNQGKHDQANQMMRSIAPKTGRGHLPAHAWLAADRMQRQGVQSRQELDILLHDLSNACLWSGAGPLLMSIYADLLVREDRVPDAVTVLQAAAEQDSTLTIKIAGLAKQNQRADLFDSIWAKTQQILQEKINQGLGSETDYVVVASVMLLNESADQGIYVSQKGLHQFPKSTQIMRVLSNAFIVKFDETRKSQEKGQEYKLELLDLAMKADPTNPSVMEKIGELAANQTLTNDQVSSLFREQLASGRSTAISHLLLAIGHLRENQLDKALVHLELAHQLAPNNPIILNNLALALARIRPEQLPRARAYIEQAIKVGGADPERLDTYGEILSLGGDYLSAIRAFEAALARKPDSETTRAKLAEAYEKVSLEEMADSVRNTQPQSKPEQSMESGS